MPTSWKRLSFANSVRSGASSWHGTHQDAQTLTRLTLPLNAAGSRPGIWALSACNPSSGGSMVCGTGRPISAEGIREGSPLPSRNQNNSARPMKAISGSTIRKVRRCGGADVDCSLILDLSWPIRRATAGATSHAAALELAQALCLATIIEHDPADQDHDHEAGRGIGRHDERRIGTERHDHAAPTSFEVLPSREPVPTSENATRLACIICRDRTRRRKISLRIAARCSVTNSRVNAIAITSNGIKKDLSSDEPPIRITEAGWCSVFHQSTENLMIGRLMAPTSVSTARAGAAREGSSTARHSAIRPRYIRNRISTEVSRASHSQ